MFRWWPILLLFPLPLLADGAYQLTAEEWSRPRQGASVVELPALHAVLREFQRQPESRIVIRYPGGEEGVLWVEELRSWMVALGVPSSRIVLQPGSSRQDALDLRVTGIR
ncbi:MAG: hypothetical protein Kow006_29060 [Gammaproteobacteria bacterium]